MLNRVGLSVFDRKGFNLMCLSISKHNICGFTFSSNHSQSPGKMSRRPQHISHEFIPMRLFFMQSGNAKMCNMTSDMREPPLRKTWEYSNISQSLISYERGWHLACLEDLIKPNQASHQGARCFYAKSTCLGSNYRNINSLTLVQKVISRYLQRTVDNYSRAYLWLIAHDLLHGVPLMDGERNGDYFCLGRPNSGDQTTQG
jgi:hypothetical protein